MNGFVRGVIAFFFIVGISNDVFADFTSYDLTLYSPESWTGDGDEYAGTNFWSHRYWNFVTDRDECGSRGCDFNTATHSGIDYRVTNQNNIIYSYGFGKVVRRGAAYGQVSIRHLVNTGEYFQVNLLHSSGIDSSIAENNYITKEQFIGIKSGIGANGTVTYAPHLHLEIADSVTLRVPLTDNAYPGPEELRPSDPAFVKGGLIAHYDSARTDIRYYNPNVFAEIKREAIPFLCRTTNFPDESEYDVYGIAATTIYGGLNLTGTFQRSSIVVRDFFVRSQVGTQGELEDELRFLGGKNESSFVDGIEGENIYSEGDYLFVAYVNNEDEHRFGYPVKFSFVQEGSIIIDNDQLNADSDSGNDSMYEPAYNGSIGSKIPGYFLTADLHKGKSMAFAQWKPYTEGTYEIYVHIPEYGPTATSVRYVIKADGTNPVYSQPINQTVNNGQWVRVTTDTQDVFDLTDVGYIGLHLGDEPDDINYGIPESQSVAFDAVKFKLVSDTGITSLSSGEQISASVERRAWSMYKISSTFSDSQLKVDLTGLTADLDLYVRQGVEPTLGDYDCRPYSGGTSSENCTMTNAGATDWYIGVYGYQAGDFDLEAVLLGATSATPLISDEQVSGTADEQSWVHYIVTASSADTNLQVDLTNLSADLDLYVKQGGMPTLSSYDCRPYRSGTTSENCTLANSGETDWYISVHGYQAGSFDLEAVLSGSGANVTMLNSREQVSDAAGYHAWKKYKIVSSASDSLLQVNMTNLSADLDLYVQQGEEPTLTSYACRPYHGGTSDESCTLANSGETEWYINVYGFQAGNFDLEAVLSGSGASVVELTSGEHVSDTVEYDDWKQYKIISSASDTELQVDLTDLSADVDLYVKQGAVPTLSSYDCRPYRGGTTSESCTLSNNGETEWYISVHGYRAGNFELEAILSGDNSVTTLTSGNQVSDSIDYQTWKQFKITAGSSDTMLQVELSGLSADLDLYVKQGEVPTSSSYDCRPYLAGTNSEHCTMTNSGETDWYIGVYGYQAGDFDLKVLTNRPLEPTHKAIFLTSERYNGNLGGVGGADQKCNERARAAGLQGEFKALISGSVLKARDRMQNAGLPYVNVRAELIAENMEVLFTGELQRPLTMNEYGFDVEITRAPSIPCGTVWTNITSSPFPDPIGDSSCNNWLSASPEEIGLVGNPASPAWYRLEYDTFSCAGHSRLYCVEQ